MQQGFCFSKHVTWISLDYILLSYASILFLRFLMKFSFFNFFANQHPYKHDSNLKTVSLTLPRAGYLEALRGEGGPVGPPSIKSLFLIVQAGKWVHIIFKPTSIKKWKNIPWWLPRLLTSLSLNDVTKWSLVMGRWLKSTELVNGLR